MYEPQWISFAERRRAVLEQQFLAQQHFRSKVRNLRGLIVSDNLLWRSLTSHALARSAYGADGTGPGLSA